LQKLKTALENLRAAVVEKSEMVGGAVNKWEETPRKINELVDRSASKN